MKEQLLAYLMSLFLKMLSPDLLRDFIDTALDFAEKKVIGSASTVDDKLVLPICSMIREATNVPDDDTDQLNPV